VSAEEKCIQELSFDIENLYLEVLISEIQLTRLYDVG